MMGQLLLPKSFSPDFNNPKVQPNEDLVEIDWQNPLTKGLLFYSIGFRDLVTGEVAGPAVDFSPSLSGIERGIHGLGLESHANTDGGWVYPGTMVVKLDGQPFLTFALIVSLDSSASFGAITASPLSRTSFNSPFYHASLTRSSTTTAGRFTFNRSGNFTTATSNTGYLDYDGAPHLLSITKNDTTTTKFYKDGAQHTDVTAANLDANITASSGQSAIYSLQNTGGAFGSESTNGRTWLSAWWARELTAGEHAQLAANPYALLKPRVSTLYYFPAAAEGQLNLNRISSMHFMRQYEPISMGV